MTTRYIRSMLASAAPMLAMVHMAAKDSGIPNEAWQDVDESALPKNIAAKAKTARAAYDAYKAANTEYFDALREGFKAQGVIGEGETMVLKRMGWGTLRGAVVPETATVRGKAAPKAKFALKTK